MPQLDHTAFPYIIDLILFHAEPTAITAFSATCKAYRARLASWLRHASLALDSSAEFHLLPLNLHAGALTPPVLPLVPSLVRNLDVIPQPNQPRDVLKALHSKRNYGFALDFLRQLDTPHDSARNSFTAHISRQADTLVHFIDLDRWPVPGVGRQEYTMDLGTSKLRHVLHLQWCDDDDESTHTLDNVRFNWNNMYDGYQYVFVLHPCMYVGAAQNPQRARKILLGLLWETIHLDLGPEFNATFTIVGLEGTDLSKLHPLGTENLVNEDVPDLFRPFVAWFEFFIDETDADDTETNLDIFRRSTRYLTMDEWRAELDKEEQEMIGDWFDYQDS